MYLVLVFQWLDRLTLVQKVTASISVWGSETFSKFPEKSWLAKKYIMVIKLQDLYWHLLDLSNWISSLLIRTCVDFLCVWSSQTWSHSHLYILSRYNVILDTVGGNLDLFSGNKSCQNSTYILLAPPLLGNIDNSGWLLGMLRSGGEFLGSSVSQVYIKILIRC